ncbi:hypothetical protein [Sphingomonas oryzagri]|uniref:Uncharacterized protein n=1 Tax=Sphingomonas oryzagri TaxID=3042314 RepID=A0ABT6N7U9_9SPHN|nr:hypothetical protein [Sphingomonas oryzagri]MDH7641191.1 hypothetical protein [Sphingomonas oryzagri]
MSAIVAWLLGHLLTVGLASIPGVGGIALLLRYGGSVIGWLADHRKDAVMMLIAAVAAGLYAWGAIGRADRAQLAAWGDKVCASAGAELQPAKGKRGADCAARIADLAREERDTLKVSNAALADARARDQARSRQDVASARADAQRAADAATKMEKANGAIGANDQVGSDWFDSLNRLGGLRGPSE